MSDLISTINNLKTLDMNKIKSKGYSLDICGKKINIIRTTKVWVITIMSKNQLKYIYRFTFGVYDSIQLNDGTIFINVEELVSNIIEMLYK